jgi:hypothetical protein
MDTAWITSTINPMLSGSMMHQGEVEQSNMAAWFSLMDIKEAVSWRYFSMSLTKPGNNHTLSPNTEKPTASGEKTSTDLKRHWKNIIFS